MSDSIRARFAGKVCVIAGAGGVIAQAVAARLSGEGAILVGIDRVPLGPAPTVVAVVTSSTDPSTPLTARNQQHATTGTTREASASERCSDQCKNMDVRYPHSRRSCATMSSPVLPGLEPQSRIPGKDRRNNEQV